MERQFAPVLAALLLSISSASAEDPRDSMASVAPSAEAVSPLKVVGFVSKFAATLEFAIEAGELAQIKGDSDSKVYASRIISEAKDLLFRDSQTGAPVA